MSIYELKELIENEGLGYALTDYINGEEIEDPTLRAIWKAAAILAKEIERYLEAA